MTEDELRKVFQEPAREPQLFLLDAVDRNRIVFAFICRFPPGQRVLRIVDENIPTTRHRIDPKRCFYYAGALRNQLMKHQRNGDADLVQWTNWPSVAAAISGLIKQFNAAQDKRMQREQPVRTSVAKAVDAAPFYFRRFDPPTPAATQDVELLESAAAALDAQPVPQEGRQMYDQNTDSIVPAPTGGGDFAGAGAGGDFEAPSPAPTPQEDSNAAGNVDTAGSEVSSGDA